MSAIEKRFYGIRRQAGFSPQACGLGMPGPCEHRLPEAGHDVAGSEAEDLRIPRMGTNMSYYIMKRIEGIRRREGSLEDKKSRKTVKYSKVKKAERGRSQKKHEKGREKTGGRFCEASGTDPYRDAESAGSKK